MRLDRLGPRGRNIALAVIATFTAWLVGGLVWIACILTDLSTIPTAVAVGASAIATGYILGRTGFGR